MITKLLFFMLLCSTLADSIHLLGEVKTVEVLLDGKAGLPCDVSSSKSNDSLLLVAWYKNTKPIYSYDGRLGKHWRDPKFPGSSRLVFTFLSSPATLYLSSATLDDAGVYRCRTDFALTPTKNSAIKLVVIVLPSKPFFLDEIGNKVEGSVGPYHEDDTLLLQCLVIGGRPSPKVTWWKSDILLDNTYEPSEIPGVTENQLLVVLTRDFAFSQIHCSASNNNVTKPLISTLDIELYVKPETVSIMISKTALSVGQQYEIPCFANGSHPKPEVVWLLDNKPINNYSIITKELNDEVISILHLTPKVEYNGLDLTCLAVNRIMAPNHGSKKQTIRLNVFFSPVVSIILVNDDYGKGSVKEGDAIQLRCMIEANPWITNTMWFANNISISGSSLNGSRISMTSSDLIIFDVSISHTGLYHCKAFNIEGNGSSKQLQVNVMYKPRCVSKENTILLEESFITCQINAFPKPNRFFWRVNWKNSSEYNKNILITETNMLEFKLINDLVGDDYLDEALLTCWGSNLVGEQKIPCNLHVIIPAMKIPKPPESCNVEREHNNLVISCSQGNISESQMYVLSVWQKVNDTKVIVSNITSPISNLRVSGLQYGSFYEVTMYSYNIWGKSEEISLFEDTILYSAFTMGDMSVNIGLMSGIVIGLLVTMCFIIAIVIFKIRSKNKSSNTLEDTKNVINLNDRNNIMIASNPDIVEKPLLVNNKSINKDVPPAVNRRHKPTLLDNINVNRSDTECCFRTSRNKRENIKPNGRVIANNPMTIHVFALSKESVV